MNEKKYIELRLPEIKENILRLDIEQLYQYFSSINVCGCNCCVEKCINAWIDSLKEYDYSFYSLNYTKIIEVQRFSKIKVAKTYPLCV